MQTQEDVAADTMPLFSEARAQRLQDRRDVAAAGGSITGVVGEVPTVVESEVQPVARRRRGKRVENWQWFMAGGAPQDFVPEILEGGRISSSRKKEQQPFYTAREAENRVSEAYDTETYDTEAYDNEAYGTEAYGTEASLSNLDEEQFEEIAKDLEEDPGETE